MCDGTGLAEAMLGLAGFKILSVIDEGGERVITIETAAVVVGCPGCGRRAEAHDRMTVAYRDLECFGTPTRLVWVKRRWRCVDSDCAARTWTETSDDLPERHVLSRRAGIDACVLVGRDAMPVASQARRFAVSWETIMNAVEHNGRPLVDDPDRVQGCRSLGVDETSFQAATPTQKTQYVTGLINLDRGVVVDLIEGRQAADLGLWLDQAGASWCRQVRVVATDLVDSYRKGMVGRLDHSVKVADGFHVVRVAQRCLTRVRTRVQREQTGHRGRKHDPLYRQRRIFDTGAERLNERGIERLLEGFRLGDPHDEVLGAWLAKEMVRDVYLTDNINLATVLLVRATTACLADEVPEIQALGRTLSKWRTEILNHHRTGASNGPTEGMNLCIKKVKRAGHGFHRFDHYRLRVLLHTGGCDWDRLTTRPRPIRTRCSPPK